MTGIPTSLQCVFFDVGDTLTFLDVDQLAAHLAHFGIQVASEQLLQGQASVRPSIDEAVLGRLAAYERAQAAGEGHDVMKLHESADGYLRWMGAIVRAAAPHVDSPTRRRAVAALRAEEPQDGESMFDHIDPALVPTLETLRAAGLKLGVISNAEGTVEERLHERGFGHHFDVIIDSAVVGIEKPYRGIFDIALDRMGADPARSVHIGDFYGFDIVGARGVGIAGILMDPSETYRTHYPDVPAITGIAELPRLLGVA